MGKEIVPQLTRIPQCIPMTSELYTETSISPPPFSGPFRIFMVNGFCGEKQILLILCRRFPYQ